VSLFLPPGLYRLALTAYAANLDGSRKTISRSKTKMGKPAYPEFTGNGKLALECDNGSLVVGDVSTYKPKKCGPAFQAKPIS